MRDDAPGESADVVDSSADQAWLLPPRTPTRRDWESLRRTRGSLMRELMNNEIRSMTLAGRVLDVGGGAHASYNGLLDGGADVVSVNIDPEIEPTVVTDLARPLPFDDESFDTVISFNTLEHIADDQFALDEMVRVLRPGATLHVLVPYLYPVHGHPNDYHRHTANGWNLMVQRAGIPSELQQIRPLVWDPFSSAWAIADIAPLGRNWWRARRFVRPLVLRRPLHMKPVDRRLGGDHRAHIAAYALAYHIEARKPAQQP